MTKQDRRWFTLCHFILGAGASPTCFLPRRKAGIQATENDMNSFFVALGDFMTTTFDFMTTTFDFMTKSRVPHPRSPTPQSQPHKANPTKPTPQSQPHKANPTKQSLHTSPPHSALATRSANEYKHHCDAGTCTIGNNRPNGDRNPKAQPQTTSSDSKIGHLARLAAKNGRSAAKSRTSIDEAETRHDNT